MKAVIKCQLDAGKFEPFSTSYRTAYFAVKKKQGDPRLVFNLGDLNAITICDAVLPPWPDDFAESFVGHHIFMLADIMAGFDNCILASVSRDLTTFQCPFGSLRLTRLPQGYTNAMPEFSQCILHTLGDMLPNEADAFVDDVGVKGPSTDYDDKAVAGNSNIQRFMYEFACTANKLLARFVEAGITASGSKLVIAIPRLKIVGSLIYRSLYDRK